MLEITVTCATGKCIPARGSDLLMGLLMCVSWQVRLLLSQTASIPCLSLCRTEVQHCCHL